MEAGTRADTRAGSGPLLTLDPALLDFCGRWQSAMAPAASLDLADRRRHFEAVSRAFQGPLPPEVDSDRELHVPFRGRTLRMRVLAPRTAGTGSGLLFLHGGGWQLGSPESHWEIAAHLAAGSGSHVFSLDYGRCPEAPFPQALEEAAAACRWLIGNASMVGVEPHRLAVAGDSAGGNLAAVVSILLRSQLSGCLLFYPVCDAAMDRPSVLVQAEGPMLTRANLERAWAAYCPPDVRVADWRHAPLAAPDLAGTPPTYIAAAGHDPTKDGAIAYARALRDADCPVSLEVEPSLCHAHLHGLSHAPASAAALMRAARWLRDLRP